MRNKVRVTDEKTNEQSVYGKVKSFVRKDIKIRGISEAPQDWLISLDDENKLFSARGFDKENQELFNIWDREQGKYLLDTFMPIVDQNGPIMIVGSNAMGYKVFSCVDRKFIDFENKEFNRCFILKDQVVLANSAAELVILHEDSDYNKPKYYFLKKHLTKILGESFEVLQYSLVDKILLVKGIPAYPYYLYFIEDRELVFYD